MPHYSNEIVKEDGLLCGNSNYSNKNYYAYGVEAGPLLIVENQTTTSFDRTLGVPLIVNMPADRKISQTHVLNNILPKIRDLLCSNSNSDETSADENAHTVSEDEIKKGNKWGAAWNENAPTPAEVIVSFDKNEFKLSESPNQVSYYYYCLIKYFLNFVF